MAIMMIYFLWTIIKKQTSSGSIVTTATTNTSQHTPTTYNNQMSIHVWLNELNEFIEANKINKEEEKQATILNHLDKSSKNIIKISTDNCSLKERSGPKRSLAHPPTKVPTMPEKP